MGLSSTFNDHAGGSDRRDDNRDHEHRGYSGTIAGFDGTDTPQDMADISASAGKPGKIDPIVLPTQFNGIPEKERNKRIDALRKLIDEKLADMTRQLALAEGSPAAVQGWYSANTIDRVYKDVVEDKPLNRADIDKELPSALSSYAALDRIQTRNGRSMGHKEFLDGLLGTRPEHTLLGSLSGKLANEQETFLRDLKQAGEKILTLAAAQVAAAQQKLEQIKEESWQDFADLHKFYAAVTAEILERNPDGVLSAVRSATEKGLDARDLRTLLEKPIRGHASVTDALSAFSLSARDEMEITARIMVALDNDFEAINFIGNTIRTLKDPVRQKNYQGFADAFIGNYVPMEKDSFFNADIVTNAEYEDGALTLHTPSKTGTVRTRELQMPPQEADNLLRQLFRRRNFSSITETTGFNTDNIISASYHPMLGLIWTNRGGPDGKETSHSMVDRETVLHALSRLTDKPGFMLLPEGTVINTRHVRSIRYDTERNELVWKTSGGNAGYVDNYLPMAQSDAVKVLVEFAKRPDMTMLSLTDFVSTKSIHSVEYDEQQGNIICLLRGGPNGYYELFNGSAEKDAAQTLVKKLGDSGEFHRFNSHSVLNTDIVQSVQYERDEQRLVYRLAGGRTGAHELWVDQSTPRQAISTFRAFAENPSFGEYVHPNNDTILNVKYIQSMEFLRDHDTLAYCLTGGKNGCTDHQTPSDTETAMQIVDKLTASEKYIELKRGNIIEKAAILSAWHEPRKFNYQLAGGEHGHVDWQTPMSAADTARIQKELTKDPDLHILGNRLVRLSKMVRAGYLPEHGTVTWTMIGGKEGTFTDREDVSETEARKLLRALRVLGQRDYLARNFKISPEDLNQTIANAHAADKQSAPDAGAKIGSLVEYVPWVVFASSSFISDPDAGLANMKIDFPENELNEIAGRKNPLLDLIPKKRKGVSSDNDFSTLLDIMGDNDDFDDGEADTTLTENNDSSNEIVALPGPGNTLTSELQVFINEESMDVFWGTDKAFDQFETAKTEEFLNAVKSNSAVQDAANRWGTLGDTEKLAVLDNLARVQAEIFGFDAVPVIPMLEAPQGTLLVNARFNPALDEKGCIEINVHPKSTLKDFVRAAASIVHENTHNWQRQLAAAVTDGTLQKGDALYQQARDFQLALATQANVQHSFGQYLMESTERHARKAAGAFQAGLTAHLDSLKPAVGGITPAAPGAKNG